MTVRAGFLLWAALASPGSVGAGQATEMAKSATPDMPVIRISVDLVQVDAVVTDESGRLVTDLRPEDFTILENGEPQKIARIAFVEAGGPASTAGGAAEGSTPHMRAPRTIVFIVDDLGISFFSAAAARSALLEFAREPFVAGEHVAIVRTGQDELTYPFFENNKPLIAAASKLRHNLRSLDAVPGYDSFSHRVTALVGAVDGLSRVPGRKAVVLLSEGFTLTKGTYQEHGLHSVYDSLFSDDDFQAAVRMMVDVANRASVVFYVVDPRGVGPDLTSEDTLVDLADKTGGLTIMNRNSIADSLREILADQAGYYLIGYEPTPSTFEKESGKPRFHSVKVEVDRPDLKVRSRSGFYGVTDDEMAARAPKR
jgi:VWFA-related protein